MQLQVIAKYSSHFCSNTVITQLCIYVGYIRAMFYSDIFTHFMLQVKNYPQQILSDVLLWKFNGT